MAGGAKTENGSNAEIYESVIKIVFSWVILMPIAVMVSGKLMAQTVKLSGQHGQLFQISIPKVIKIRANNDEVILGFGLFIVLLAIDGMVAGQVLYRLIVTNFGIDPGHFNALCIFSAFASVFLSGFVYGLSGCVALLRRRGDPQLRKYEQTIERLAAEKRQDDMAGKTSTEKHRQGRGA